MTLARAALDRCEGSTSLLLDFSVKTAEHFLAFFSLTAGGMKKSALPLLFAMAEDYGNGDTFTP